MYINYSLILRKKLFDVKADERSLETWSTWQKSQIQQPQITVAQLAVYTKNVLAHFSQKQNLTIHKAAYPQKLY